MNRVMVKPMPQSIAMPQTCPQLAPASIHKESVIGPICGISVDPNGV